MKHIFNQLIIKIAKYLPLIIVRQVAGKYVAGETADDALKVIKKLNNKGYSATLDILGEHTKNKKEVKNVAQEYQILLNKIHANNLDCNISIKLSHLGLDISKDYMLENINLLIKTAQKNNNFIRIDMEDSQLLAEIPTITNIEKQQNARGPDVLIKNGSPILGSVDAPLTLVEFGDYQCSFCKRHFDQTHDLIMKNYVETNKVKIVFKDLIVTPGKDSMYAAHAAHCAKDQGMFWKYHDILYNNWEGESTGWVTTDNLNKFAKNIGLDINKFSKCMSEDKWMELINASQDDANTLNVTGTPSFFLIGPWHETDEQKNEITRIHGAQPYDVFKESFDLYLKK